MLKVISWIVLGAIAVGFYVTMLVRGRRLPVILLVAVCLAGCGTSGPPIPEPRLQVTDGLRTACANTAAPEDSTIATVIGIAEAQRLAGQDFQHVLAVSVGGCLGTPLEVPCMTCATAIIRQVYGL